MINQIFMIFLMLMTIGCNISMPINQDWYEDEKGILYKQKTGNSNSRTLFTGLYQAGYEGEGSDLIKAKMVSQMVFKHFGMLMA